MEEEKNKIKNKVVEILLSCFPTSALFCFFARSV